MKITVVGQGYVGLNISIGAAKAGYTVIGIDHDPALIRNLSNGVTFIPGISKSEILELIDSQNYVPTTEFEKISDSSIVVIAVPTPLGKNRKPDLSALELVSETLGRYLDNVTLIVNESTSYPGTLRNLIKPLVEKNSKLKHLYASAPERIDPGNTEWNLSNTPRVIGGLTVNATEKATAFYKTFCNQIYQVSSPEVAEAAKLFENSFRQINIALVNEFAKISDSLGFSTHEAIRAASTKPFGFMPFFPSIGVGGHCIPVDPSYLSYAAEQVGISASFIELANKTNLSMVNYITERIEKLLKRPLKDLKIQIAGISYKADIPDLRESPVLELIDVLRKKGAKVSWADPLVQHWNGEFSETLSGNIDLGLIVTPHEVLNFDIWEKSNIKVLDLSSNDKNYGWPKFL